MAAGIVAPTTKVTSPLLLKRSGGQSEYTWFYGRIVAFIAYKICRDLLLDLKEMVEKIDAEYENGGGARRSSWMNLSRITETYRFDHCLFKDSIVDGGAKTDIYTREFQYKDFDGMLRFFDEVYADQFENFLSFEKIRTFLGDEIDGFGKKTRGMRNLSLLRTIVNTKCGIWIAENHGFNGLGNMRRGKDYITRAYDQLMTTRPTKMVHTYAVIIYDVWSHVRAIMTAATHLHTYFKLHDRTCETTRECSQKRPIVGPPLTLNTNVVTYTNKACMTGLIQLDMVISEFQRKRDSRRKSVIFSRLCMRKKTMPELRGTCM